MQTIDIPRIVSVYHSFPFAERWWTKAWFNGHENGEASIEITREQAIKFLHDEIAKDAWLEVLYAALEQTREQMTNQYKQAIS